MGNKNKKNKNLFITSRLVPHIITLVAFVLLLAAFVGLDRSTVIEPALGVPLLGASLLCLGIYYGAIISKKVNFQGLSRAQVWSLTAIAFLVSGLFLYIGFTFGI